MTGTSGTPLVQKLGIQPGHRVALLDAPDGFALRATSSPSRRSTSPARSNANYDILCIARQ
jgi:hypothetical protein